MSRQNPSGSRPLSEQAAELIRQYITDKEMTVGDKLPNEFQLMEICKVGRSTVREAIKILSFEGLVEVIRGNGTYIAEQKTSEEKDDPIGLFEADKDLPKKALEFFDVRLILEPEIAAMAATNATYEDCQRLQSLQERVKKEILAGRPHYRCDTQFHMQIARCSKNRIAYKLMEIITKGIPVFIKVTKNSMTDQTMLYHKVIADAISSGDAVGARCGMISHLSYNRSMILEEIGKQR